MDFCERDYIKKISGNMPITSPIKVYRSCNQRVSHSLSHRLSNKRISSERNLEHKTCYCKVANYYDLSTNKAAALKRKHTKSSLEEKRKRINSASEHPLKTNYLSKNLTGVQKNYVKRSVPNSKIECTKQYPKQIDSLKSLLTTECQKPCLKRYTSSKNAKTELKRSDKAAKVPLKESSHMRYNDASFVPDIRYEYPIPNFQRKFPPENLILHDKLFKNGTNYTYEDKENHYKCNVKTDIPHQYGKSGKFCKCHDFKCKQTRHVKTCCNHKNSLPINSIESYNSWLLELAEYRKTHWFDCHYHNIDNSL